MERDGIFQLGPFRESLFTKELFLFYFTFLVAACGIQLLDQVLNLGPLTWELGVLTTGPPGRSQGLFLKGANVLGKQKEIVYDSLELLLLVDQKGRKGRGETRTWKQRILSRRPLSEWPAGCR